eukprot:TRINITY_DN7938_c0_g1_i1.p1 TRINITY_DN7938_c0_g1~~TRINITY_DN7938_c0_g1_i1.p1  ORF type:complete len:479 (+),score=84.73 TRINITY_DN7938_c0_g1_i1:32-1468(+)
MSNSIEDLLKFSLEELLDQFPDIPTIFPDIPSKNFPLVERHISKLESIASSPFLDVNNDRSFSDIGQNNQHYTRRMTVVKEGENGDFIPDYTGYEESNDHSRLRSPTIIEEVPPPVIPFDFSTLLKGVRKQLSPQEQQTLNASLLDLSTPELLSNLTKAYSMLESSAQVEVKKKKFSMFLSQPTFVTLSKYVLDFNLKGEPAPLNRNLVDRLMITCKSGTKAQFHFLPGKPLKTHTLTFSVTSSVVKKKNPVFVDINLIIKTTLLLRQVICVDVEGVGRYFLIINFESEKSLFGVDFSELPLTNDNGLTVPTVLVTMKKYLYENGGLEQEGVFRLAGDEKETIGVKEQLNTETFTGCSDINCVANLIKVWFREMPQQLLNQLPSSSFLSIEAEDDCVQLLETLKEPNKTLLLWLLDLLADFAAKESINKMTPRNLAIVVAPNLFTTPPEVSPVDSLMLSQKVVNFVIKVLEHRIRSRE